MSQNMVAAPPKIRVEGTVTLPPGMTQEEADRLVAEADAAQHAKDNN